MEGSGSSRFHISSANPPLTTSSSSKSSPAADSTPFVAIVVPPAPIRLLNILIQTVVHIIVAEFRTLRTRRRLALLFLAVTVLVTIVGGMQPQERRLQNGGGNSGGGGGRIVVEPGAAVVVCLFVVAVLSPVKMEDVGKPGRLVFGCCRALVQDPDALLPPSYLPPNNAVIVKGVVDILVLVFVVRARAEVRDDS